MKRKPIDLEGQKTCARCKKSKPGADFYMRGRWRQSWCKPCFNAYCMQRWSTRKAQYVAFLGGHCVDCGTVFPPAVFDFHHVGSKDFDWSKLRLRSDAEIRKELAKCVLLCANCHRKRHADERT